MRLLLLGFIFAVLAFGQNPPSIFFTTNVATGPASTPTFSPVAGTVSSGTNVTISTATSGCDPYIYYTIDGSTPDAGDTNSTVNNVTSSRTIKAKVIGCPGYPDSAVGSAAYTVVLPPTDTFTGSNGTNLTSHTSDSGHTWTAKGANSVIALDGSGNAVASNELGTTGAVYFSSYAPPSADYYVELTTTTTDKSVQVICRGTGTTSLVNGYFGGYNHTATQLWIRRYLTGGASTIGTFTWTLSAGDVIRLSCVGSSIQLSVNGDVKISATNSDVTATGSAGIGVRTGGSINGWGAGQ
jgi:hypothetical protein